LSVTQPQQTRYSGNSVVGSARGSAGVYNLEQPEIVDRLGQRKAESILRTGGGGDDAGLPLP
jgi:hypothetical protein